MRLLFVGTSPEPGGAASHFLSLATAMAAAGHQVAAAALPGSLIWRSLEADGRVPLFAVDFGTKLEPAAMRALRRAVREWRPDWIIAAFQRDYWGAALVAAAGNVPLAIFVHHAGLRYYHRHVFPRFVRRYLFPSAFLRQWFIDRGLSPERSRVLYNPIDAGFYRPDPPLREAQRVALGVKPGDVLVSYIGRIEANKGVVTLAEAMERAMARVPSLRALWVGFGQLDAAIERIIERSPDPSRHIRRPWSDDVRPYYAATDLLVLPSAGPEAFGRVLAEAQASGIPVLGSAIGGIGEAMNVGITGRLVAAGDMPAWAVALQQLATDAASRCTMGAAGPAFVRASFHSEVIVRQFEDLLRG